MSSVVSFQNVSFSYPSGPEILRNIQLDILDREFLGIVGPNGSGKTTLVNLMVGLLKPTSGEIRVLNHSPEAAGKLIGYVPQFRKFPRDFPISVKDAVLMGRLGITRPLLGYKREDYNFIEHLLTELDLSELKDTPIAKLSGGQLQRILIARALACEPKLLVLDEPTASVDPRGEEEVYDLLKTLNRKITVIVVSHDIGFISKYINRVACLNQTLACHPTSELSPELIQQLYGSQVHMIDHHQN